ncbi:MAG: hypothetical protein ACTSVI_15145 [Promethearchaeota archaeon]
MELEKKLTFITDNFPRYFWRCIAQAPKNNDLERVFEIIFDATDLIDSTYIYKIIFYDKKLLSIIHNNMNIQQDEVQKYYMKAIEDMNKYEIFKVKIKESIRFYDIPV